MQVRAYLFFDGRCDEAIAFYQSAIGAKVEMLMRFEQSPAPTSQIPPGFEKKVMHATLSIGDSIVNVSDGHCEGVAKFDGISLTVVADDVEQSKKLFDGLAAGGKVTMPLQKTFFTPSFGMCTDRFGVSWMVMVEAS